MSGRKSALLIVIAVAAVAAAAVGAVLALREKPENQTSIANPVAGMSEEEAMRIAKELGEGKDMGTRKTMSGEQFLKWWRSSNNITDESADGTISETEEGETAH